MSLSNSCCSFPGGAFFMRHVVMMNYAGKVYTFVRGIEMVVDKDTEVFTKVIFSCYSLFMLLGMYWYTRFWLEKDDLESYYADSDDHVLIRFAKKCLKSRANKLVTFFAASYYLLFFMLFLGVYSSDNVPAALSFSIWNLWCAMNLFLAMQDQDKGRGYASVGGGNNKVGSLS